MTSALSRRARRPTYQPSWLRQARQSDTSTAPTRHSAGSLNKGASALSSLARFFSPRSISYAAPSTPNESVARGLPFTSPSGGPSASPPWRSWVPGGPAADPVLAQAGGALAGLECSPRWSTGARRPAGAARGTCRGPQRAVVPVRLICGELAERTAAAMALMRVREL